VLHDVADAMSRGEIPMIEKWMHFYIHAMKKTCNVSQE